MKNGVGGGRKLRRRVRKRERTREERMNLGERRELLGLK